MDKKPQTIFEKIVAGHLEAGSPQPNQEIALAIDQTLTQDSLGAVAYLQFESLQKERVQTETSVAYCDHLLIQHGPANMDVHRYQASVAANYGLWFSKPGNGICHQVHLERFSKPGRTLLGGDSHTVTCGAAGMLAMGAGGLDIALAMAGQPYYLRYPRLVRILLEGQLPAWCTAKDIALAVLCHFGCKGNQGSVFEYDGPALAQLSLPERATITNMGAESGVMTSIFPSDHQTLDFFRRQQREQDWQELKADADAIYDEEFRLDLSSLEPMVALPHSPDLVKPVRELSGLPLHQVLIGSCTNSSYQDMMTVARILRGKKIPTQLSLGIAPGSRQVLQMLAANGALADMIAAGARILEPGCGFCVGQGQSPQTKGVSLRTSNRNYCGRSGTQDAEVYLSSPQTAAVSALAGCLTSPQADGAAPPSITLPDHFTVDDSMLIPPSYQGEIYRSPIIGRPPQNTAMPEHLRGQVAIKLGDNINTDDIIPGGPAMDYRANIEKSCEFIFQYIDDSFPRRCQELKTQGLAALIVAGEAYGQGSSREHAAMCPMVMGIKMVIAKSIERIHMANLVNFGILPLTFADPADYQQIAPDELIELPDLSEALSKQELSLIISGSNRKILVRHSLSARQIEIIKAGGLLNFIANKN